jgi:hypothetical protein
MIFLSHNSNDKPVVEQIAVALEAKFGREQVFYDSWSMQPGDGIIDKMNEGLASAKFLFLFVSQNSLASKMVSLEWQNALYKSVRGDLKIVPVRLDGVALPAILSQNLYIDLVNQGLEVATRQIIDVVEGKNTFQPSAGFANVRAYVSQIGEGLKLEVRAEAYMEPQSHYLVLLPHGSEMPEYQVISDGQHSYNFLPDYKTSDGRRFTALSVQVLRATSVGFPVVLMFPLGTQVQMVMRAVSSELFHSIPMIKASDEPVSFGTIASLSNPDPFNLRQLDRN